MKIKEVLEITGLTDRAVRLYVEYGLISPETKYSYSGRKNIEFSNEDVEKLKCISLLRKADFSLPQISRISGGGKDASDALAEFLADKRESHASDGEIIASLEGFEGDVTLENVASALEKGNTKQREIKDLYLTYHEEAEKQTFLAFGIFIIFVASLAIILPPIFYFSNIIFPKISFLGILFHIVLYIPVILVLIIGITLITRYRRGTVNICSKKKRVISIISIILAILISFVGFIGVFVSTMFPYVYTETRDTDNYLVLNEHTLISYRDLISKLFPACIPNSSNNLTKYHYYSDFNIYETEYIFAEWDLEEEDFEKEKSRINIMFPDSTIKNKNDFTIVYVKEYNKTDGVKAYFAYNDDTHIVRYVLDYYYEVEHDGHLWD